MNELMFVIYALFVTVMWLVFHEVGHFLVALKLGLHPHFALGSPKNWTLAEVRCNPSFLHSKNDLIYVAIGGIFELVPIFCLLPFELWILMIGVTLGYCIWEIHFVLKQFRVLTDAKFRSGMGL